MKRLLLKLKKMVQTSLNQLITSLLQLKLREKPEVLFFHYRIVDFTGEVLASSELMQEFDGYNKAKKAYRVAERVQQDNRWDNTSSIIVTVSQKSIK